MNPDRRHALVRLAALPLSALWLPSSFVAVSAVTAANAQPAAAGRVQVEGQWFDATARVAGSELRLNGTGVRAVAWFKGYAAGLYLADKAGSAAQAVDMAGPKRLQIRMLAEAPAAEFVKALNKGVLRNLSAAELAALEAPLDQLEARIAALGKVRVGDVVDLDHEPGRGLVMRVNGTLRGDAIVGDDLFAAVLRSFVGNRPYDEKLKAGLLGSSG
ncbi:MAG: chalcone isomerase family protein [Chitinophagaceae bacterium]|nr:chalcone isomerase family protein [Rubrivivax sp.]